MIENEQEQQQVMMQRQDDQMDQIGGVVRNLREIGEVMGNELEDQERFVQTLSSVPLTFPRP